MLDPKTLTVEEIEQAITSYAERLNKAAEDHIALDKWNEERKQVLNLLMKTRTTQWMDNMSRAFGVPPVHVVNIAVPAILVGFEIAEAHYKVGGRVILIP